MTLATCISDDICRTREPLALVNKTACKNILFCFTAVISLRGFLFFFFFAGGWGSPSLCVLVKIDRRPCVTE